MERYISTALPLGSVGLATDMPVQDRALSHYRTCENVMYELSGAIRKCGGDSRINATAITSAPTLTGMFDLWLAGTSGTFTQKFVTMTSNQKIYKEDMDGTFDDITGAASITTSAIPVFCQARDLLLIFDDKNDTPLKWSGSGNVASLGGTPPAGRGCIFHANRGWIWGVNANPSRLYYSSSTDIEDWSGADTGSIDISPDDGDRIVGAAVYKRSLVVFKGPNKGSIHVISGTAPTGGDAFSRTPLVSGIALQTHNSIVAVNDDIWFWSNRGVHSLAATQNYGNYQGAFLTRFLFSFFRQHVNSAGLARVFGVNYDEKGCVLWVYAGSGSATNNRTFGLSYLEAENGLKAFTWTRGGASAAMRKNPSSGRNEVVFGLTTGFATLQDQTDRAVAPSTAYSMRMVTPYLFYAEQDAAGRIRPYGIGTIRRLALRSVSTGNWDVSVNVQRDRTESTLHTFNQGSFLTSTTGFTLGTSRLGFDALGGGATTGGPQLAFSDVNGTARTVQLTITQGGLSQDAHLFELGIDWEPDSFQTEDL